MRPFWIDTQPRNLAIVPRPRGWDWLPDDLVALRREGITVVVSALTPAENEELGLGEEENLCHSNGLEYLAFPIEDRSVPASRESFKQLLETVERMIALGAKVGVHCRACIGRSSIIAASILIQRGLSPIVAFDVIEKARGCPVPDTKEQRLWTEAFLASDRHGAE